MPIALVGTAAAFIVGFRNNATYGRLWEARQIYGGIVNTSRTWGLMAKDFVGASPGLDAETARAAQRRLVHRHLAWLTALRFQLRQPRTWETMGQRHNAEYRDRYFTVAELTGDVRAELAGWLSPEDAAAVRGVANRAAQILALQGDDLATLRRVGAFDGHAHVALECVLASLYDHQGRCERIKNFPYPRQFATINLFFIRLFMYLVPFGLLTEFGPLGAGVWLTVPFSVIIGWVFNAMERVGQASENPFEGNPNDVPITALSRSIEIDLREMLGETELPPPLTPVHEILL